MLKAQTGNEICLQENNPGKRFLTTYREVLCEQLWLSSVSRSDVLDAHHPPPGQGINVRP